MAMKYKEGDRVSIVGVKGGRTILTGEVLKLDLLSKSSNRELDYYIVKTKEVPNLRVRVRAWAMTKIVSDSNEIVSWADMKHIWNPEKKDVDPIKR